MKVISRLRITFLIPNQTCLWRTCARNFVQYELWTFGETESEIRCLSNSRRIYLKCQSSKTQNSFFPQGFWRLKNFTSVVNLSTLNWRIWNIKSPIMFFKHQKIDKLYYLAFEKPHWRTMIFNLDYYFRIQKNAFVKQFAKLHM